MHMDAVNITHQKDIVKVLKKKNRTPKMVKVFKFQILI